MLFKVLISAFILCTIGSQNVFGQIGVGPINIKLVRMTKCPAEEDFLNMEVLDINGEQGFSLDADLPYELDNTISYNVNVDKIQNGQVHKGVFKHKGDYACEDMNKFLGDFWIKLREALGASKECPIKPGHYSVDEFVFSDDDIAVRTFLYGRFLMNVELVKDKKTILCTTIEFTNNRPGESV